MFILVAAVVAAAISPVGIDVVTADGHRRLVPVADADATAVERQLAQAAAECSRARRSVWPRNFAVGAKQAGRRRGKQADGQDHGFEHISIARAPLLPEAHKNEASDADADDEPTYGEHEGHHLADARLTEVCGEEVLWAHHVWATGRRVLASRTRATDATRVGQRARGARHKFRHSVLHELGASLPA